MPSFLSPDGENRRLPANHQINGFRAILCLLVIAYHLGALFFVRFGSFAMPTYLPQLVLVVVGVFFLLSGFFLSFQGIWDFAKGKFLRIYVPFAFVTFVVFFVCYYGGYPNYISYGQWGLNFLVYPLPMLQTKYAVGDLWFIAYLWVFFTLYWLLNVLAKPFQRKINLVPAFMLVGAVLCFSYQFIAWDSSAPVYWHRLCNMVFYNRSLYLYLGYFLRLAYDSYRKKERWLALVPLTSALLVFSFLLTRIYYQENYHWSTFVLLVGLLALFFLSLFRRLPVLALRPFQEVGSASLWIYMIHENVGYLIINVFYSLNADLYALGLALAVLYALAVGILLSKIYEKFLRFLKKQPSA
jgi:peptidoglycan/LPS O-acetylase OafA/YrhL